MDYEKKYKEALERAMQFSETPCLEDSAGIVEYIFPELNEDERIRQTLIKYHKATIDIDYIKGEKIIAWLEKQGEKPQKTSIWKHWSGNGIAGNGEGKPICLIKYGHTYSLSSCLGYECDYIELSELDKLLSEKQGEQKPFDYESANIQQNDFAPKSALEAIKGEKVDNQNCIKPADKIERKFEVGNWYQCTKDFFGKGVTFDKNTAYYCAKEGCLQGEYGCHIAIVKDLYDNFKLWTIKDAKDGDVLYSPCCKLLWIYKDEKTCHVGFNLNYNSGSIVINKPVCIPTDAIPATKEQRDLLFSKMKEAGYEWDAEKKELKKIHVIDEGKAEMDYCFTKMMNGEKVSPTWSEEDEKILNSLISSLTRISASTRTDSTSVNYTFSKEIDWLKSLRPQNRWKPSEEQIIALRQVISGCSYDIEPLVELETKLKEL